MPADQQPTLFAPENDQIVTMAKAIIDSLGDDASAFAERQLAACEPGGVADTWHRISVAISLETMMG